MSISFASPSADKAELEAAGPFTPRFDANGLVTAVVTDVRDGELLMVAHMNAEAQALTVETGVAHYYSRSRGKIWKKGESSGNLQTVHELRTDCDQDCFYRTVTKVDGAAVLEVNDDQRHFDPSVVYSDAGTR